MAVSQPHLERRKTGPYWRRRVPAHQRGRFSVAFFCFPLRTHIPRDSADLARRLSAISDLCFAAEPDVPPDVMTQILTDYARLEIETADRLRALTGPRTRAAAEAALAIEDTARRLGLTVDAADADLPVLADRMVRLMIEISEQRERRARGIFRDEQPNLGQALTRPGPPSSAPVRTVAEPVPAAAGPVVPPAAAEDETIPTAAPEAPAPPGEIVLYDLPGQTATVDASRLPPLTATDPNLRLLDLWDGWFADLETGTIVSGAYTFKGAGKAERFRKNADTIRGTRKLIADTFGNARILDLAPDDFRRFNDMLWRLPRNHGKSPKDREMTCFEIIARADAAEKREIRKARLQIDRQGLTGDAAEGLLRRAEVARLSPRTFQRHQKHLSAPLDRAVEKGLISRNPATPFVLGEAIIDGLRATRPETSRQLWGNEFQTLLGTEKWTSPKTRIDDPVYWVPLIARLHGLRSEEILQLKPKNIRRDAEIWFFDIERGSGQSVKSENGRRMAPARCGSARWARRSRVR